MSWILVNAEMPPENEKVLAIWNLGTNGPEFITVCWSKQRGWYNDDLNLKEYSISYWTYINFNFPDPWNK